MNTAYIKILKLYRCNPLDHFYAFYDLLHYPDRTIIEFYDNYSYALALVYDSPLRGTVCFVHLNCVCTYDHLVKLFRKILEKSRGSISRISITSMTNIGEILKKVCEEFNFSIISTFDYVTMVLQNLSIFYVNKGVVTKLETVEDACHVAELFRLWFGSSPSVDKLVERFRKEDWYGVKIDNRVVSMCCVYLKTPDVWVIGNVFTHPEYRGRGLAKALLSHVCKLALDKGAIPVLHVLSNNPMFNIALRTYEKVGFRIYETRFGYELTVRNSE